jgi:hypothetical protein
MLIKVGKCENFMPYNENNFAFIMVEGEAGILKFISRVSWAGFGEVHIDETFGKRFVLF